MNSDRQEGERGAYIKPSPRRSIHSYSDNMGRYGLNHPNNVQNRTSPLANEQVGFDVVDNVMSKPVREMSPSMLRKKKIHRTNSCPSEEETDDDSNVLSKSLPSTLPSHLSSSDYTELEEPNNSALSKHGMSHQGLMNMSNASSNNLQTTLERSQMDWSHHSIDNIQNSFNEGQPSSKSQTETNKSQINIIIIFSIFIGIMAALYYYVGGNYSMIFQSQQYSSYSKSTQVVNSEMKFESNMKYLQEKYHIDSDLILKLKSGISTISERMDAGSFIFVYNSNTDNFDQSQFDMFINEVASAAARYLRNGTSSKHTELSSYLDMQEHGELIDMYRDAVDKTGVLLVKEVDTVPSDLAMAFHYYCDEYEPLVKRSAIFFTLNLVNCSNSDEKKSTYDFIEKCLAEKWKTLSPENMRPLLTRLVNVIIDVTSVF